MNISDRPYQRIMRSLGLSPHMPHFGPCVCHAQPILEEEIEVLLWVAKNFVLGQWCWGDDWKQKWTKSEIEVGDRSRRSKPEKKIYESKWMARITGKKNNLPWYKSSPCRRLISAIPIAELNIRGVFDGFSQEGFICFQAAISRDFAAGEADTDSFQSTNASRADLDKVSKKSKKTRTEGMTASALCTMYVQYGMT